MNQYDGDLARELLSTSDWLWKMLARRAIAVTVDQFPSFEDRKEVGEAHNHHMNTVSESWSSFAEWGSIVIPKKLESLGSPSPTATGEIAKSR